ncbi:hypothetical protein ABCR94_13960 [Streptomyces sp. 21So2-11]|uniref:hypothetical protein n=1 Tax=Streptomyces sp. 21So2-11 TaxID=3144408 RepID=UPI00321B2430
MAQPEAPQPVPADPLGQSDAGDGETEVWRPCSADHNLTVSLAPGPPGNKQPDQDLDLHMGWDRFENFILAVSQRVLGLKGVKFRRYGVQGQTQHGIDLAGREPDGNYTVVQCKDHETFTAGNLRDAVETFAAGTRPFGSSRFIVATSASTLKTQLADELDTLQTTYPELELALWGAEQINDYLRPQGDVVARFWTRETATTWCTGAPLPGVPVPLPDRQEQAEKILLGPLKTKDFAPLLQEANAQQSTAPAEAARLYGDLANRLSSAGFGGHAVTMHTKQLEALVSAGLIDQAADLAAHLAVTALHFGDRGQPRSLAHRIEKLARDAVASKTEHAARTERHAQLVRAAMHGALHPLGDFGALQAALEARVDETPVYQPLLVLFLAENLLASESAQLQSLDTLIGTALALAQKQPIEGLPEDTVIRLRLMRAEYNPTERAELQNLARRHLLPGRHTSLISAREARRCALESRAEEATECWRDAVYSAIHCGLPQDAADWLYAIRAVNAQYGPFPSHIDDEHRLAQSLRATGTGRLLNRVRDPKEQALSALVGEKPVEAVLSARRWLADAAITGSWAGEFDALEFLAGLYRDSSEPARAASYFQRAGKAKKLKSLASAVGDLLLPIGPLSAVPWWMAYARAAHIEAQADLIDDDSAGALLGELTGLAKRGRAGELVDSPLRNLTSQATRSACGLAARGTPVQALELLELLAPDVPRGPNQYRHSDDGHAAACLHIATTHPSLAMKALTRLFDLADGGAQTALGLVADTKTLQFLTGQADSAKQPGSSPDVLSASEQSELRNRVARLDDAGQYLADVARCQIDPTHPTTRQRAAQARDRILQRPQPEPGHAELGSQLVSDSYLASCLDEDDRKSCLEKIMAIASDAREVSGTRQDALTGALNLVIGLPASTQEQTFRATKSFVLGEQNSSYLDDEVTGTPHPLSSFKVSMGPASLRGHALKLAHASATTIEERLWVRDQAVALLHSEEPSDLQAAAVTFSRLSQDVASGIDANSLAAHSHPGVRQAGAVLSLQQPTRYRDAAMRLAHDSDFRVRRTLAEAAIQAAPEAAGLTSAILELLGHDPRYSIRRATTGIYS